MPQSFLVDNRLVGGTDFDGTAGQGLVAPGVIGDHTCFRITYISFRVLTGVITSSELQVWDGDSATIEQVGCVRASSPDTIWCRMGSDLAEIPPLANGSCLQLRMISAGATGNLRFICSGYLIDTVGQ